ncbi:MAG: polyprenyl synthetase family protein [Clostridium sp.]|uniref:polyprenyl synthetase family protein n=1 Tax=Clostridium sp. TaxID=1506 RepID=UPI003EE54AE0
MDREERIYNEALIYAGKYYDELYDIYISTDYIETLKKDLEKWKERHLKKTALSEKIIKKVDVNKLKGNKYLEYLDRKNILDSYLDRSISYIYMRDLGKNIYEEEVVKKIKETTEKIKINIRSKKEEELGLDKFYEKARKNGVEDTIIWTMNKIKKIHKKIPKEMNKDEAIRKILKIIMGVIIYRDQSEDEENREELEKCIRLGYAYGITYPFIDDLFDAKILEKEEEEKYSNLIKNALIQGDVEENIEWTGKNKEFITFVTKELIESFNYIRDNIDEKRKRNFLDLSYIFFIAQEEDRKKSLNLVYEEEEVFKSIILKSSVSRLIVPAVLDKEEGFSFENNMFYYGIYNQLADDFTDIEEDFKNNRFTPYTYYLKNKKSINPFKFYWCVIYYLVYKVYKNDEKTKDIIFSRAINSLKRLKLRVNENKYNAIMGKIKFEDKELFELIKALEDRVENIEFYDKFLRDNIIERLEKNKSRKEGFKEKIKELQKEINGVLRIKGEESKIVESINYSLEGEGKRLRPIIAWIVGMEGYNLKKESLIPLIKSLEYMHTASLILDDLPSQDNADKRRGRKTVHKRYGIEIAELGSVFLTLQGLLEQVNLFDFKEKKILEIIRYSIEAIKIMCIGQELDLNSRDKKIDIEELEKICFYKTGIAFEAAILMPAILGGAKQEEKENLKEFAKYAGIAFQIKDDMLDFAGDSSVLGKEVKIDEKNNTSTFVTILGYEEAEKELYSYYLLAIKLLKKINRNTKFLKELMNYIINREK